MRSRRHIARGPRRATGASVAAVGRIEQTIGEINAIAGSIAAAVEQQGAATAEIARNVAETASATNAMTSRTAEVSEEASKTGERADTVKKLAAALQSAVSELTSSVIRVVRTGNSGGGPAPVPSLRRRSLMSDECCGPSADFRPSAGPVGGRCQTANRRRGCGRCHRHTSGRWQCLADTLCGAWRRGPYAECRLPTGRGSQQKLARCPRTDVLASGCLRTSGPMALFALRARNPYTRGSTTHRSNLGATTTRTERRLAPAGPTIKTG